jgi:hypothetical protein
MLMHIFMYARNAMNVFQETWHEQHRGKNVP